VTVSDDGPVTLAGVFDPSRLGIGFMIPVFRDARRNALLVQVVGPRGRIAGFEPAAAPGTVDFSAPPFEARNEEPAYWAFRFDDELIVGNDAQTREQLGRLLSSELASWPLVAMEVAEFLEADDQRDRFASAAFDRLAEASPKAAEVWRDLSVLTEDMRTELLKRLGPEAHWPARILVTLERSGVVIHGLPDWPNEPTIDALRAALNAVAQRMPRFYGPAEKLKLAVSSVGAPVSPKVEARIVVDRAFDLERLQWELRRRGGSEIDLVSVDSEGAFGTASAAPLLFLYRADQPERLAEAARTARGVKLTGLAWGRRSNGRAPTLPRGVRLMDIDSSEASSGEPQWGQVIGIRLAARLTLDAAAGAFKFPARHCLLIGGSGAHPRHDRHGTARLYDEARERGVNPRRAVRIIADREPEDAFSKAVAAILFPGVPTLTSPIVIRSLTTKRSSSHLLVAAARRTPRDERRHSEAMAELLGLQGWRIERLEETSLSLEGSRARLTVSTAVQLLGRTEPTTLASLAGRLGRVERLRVTSHARSGEILRHLGQTGELAVDVRDLVSFDAQGSTVWTIVGAQLRRMTQSRPSRPITLYIGLIALAALQAGSVDLPDAAALRQVLRRKSLGETNFLVVRRTSSSGKSLQALVELLVQPESQVEGEGGEVSPFVLTLGDSGPAIREPRAKAHRAP
jgi:hypothetical protein